MSPRPIKFIFCHIPKSAGTLFGQILERNFRKRFYPYYGLWDNRFFSKEDVAGMCDLHPQYECLASHMFSLDLPFESERIDFRAITFIRNPVDRALSLYSYSFRMAKLNPGYQPAGSIQDFFKSIIDNGDDARFFNAQYRFLCGENNKINGIDKIKGLSESGKLLIAPLERFEDACLILEKLYPTNFKNAAYGGRSNASKKPKHVPIELAYLLEEKNYLDWELLDIANQLFDDLFKKVFLKNDELHSARMKFQKRCSGVRFVEKAKKIQRKLIGI